MPPSIGSKVNENSQCTNFFIKSNVEKKCQDNEDSSRMQEGVETQVEKEETNKLPVLFAKNHTLQECDVPPGWNNRMNPRSKNCDKCGRYSLFAHAMIQCTQHGKIPLGIFSPKIQKARTAVAQVYLDPHIEYENVLCENVGTLGLRDQVYNYCFECYGSDFKGNRFFFVSANGKKLMAAWFNLRKRRNTVNNSEDCIVGKLLRRVTQKSKDPRIISMIGGILYPFVTNPHPCPKPLYLKSKLTPNVYLLALCGCCKAAPIKQQHWLQTIDPSYSPKVGSDDIPGKWRCAVTYEHTGACLGEWGESAHKDRVLVFNYDEHFNTSCDALW